MKTSSLMAIAAVTFVFAVSGTPARADKDYWSSDGRYVGGPNEVAEAFRAQPAAMANASPAEPGSSPTSGTNYKKEPVRPSATTGSGTQSYVAAGLTAGFPLSGNNYMK